MASRSCSYPKGVLRLNNGGGGKFGKRMGCIGGATGSLVLQYLGSMAGGDLGRGEGGGVFMIIL